jgi:hypothetical protein
MSKPNTPGAAVLDELLRELNGGIISLDLLKRTAAALEQHVKRDAARVSGDNWRKPIPEHQQDVERARVAERWAYVASCYGTSPGDGRSGLESGSLNYSAKVKWVAGREGLPVGRVRKYLREISQSKTCDLLRKHDKLSSWATCKACEQAGDACIEHASAQRIFRAALPDVPKKPRPSEKRARLKKPRPIELRLPAVNRPVSGPRRGRSGLNTFTDD